METPLTAIVKSQWGFHFALSFNMGHDLFFGINTDLGINPSSIPEPEEVPFEVFRNSFQFAKRGVYKYDLYRKF